MRRVLGALTAPLPPSKLPPVVVAAMSALGKLLVAELVEEATRVQAAQMQQQQGASGSSGSGGHSQALKPAAVIEAYQNLVAAGRIPSRVTAPPAQGAGGSRTLPNGSDAATELVQGAPAGAQVLPRPRRAKVWRR